jgi:hypothetical protein
MTLSVSDEQLKAQFMLNLPSVFATMKDDSKRASKRKKMTGYRPKASLEGATKIVLNKVRTVKVMFK